MNILPAIEKAAAEAGLSEFGCVETEKLQFHREVRAICEENKCHSYGTSWACPPAVGTIEECRARVLRYGSMMVFSKVYQLEDSFDFEGMAAGMRDFKRVVSLFQTKLDGAAAEYLLLSNEGCGRCTACTYPDAPCRFPQQLHHSLEGYGFLVSELAKAAGIRYNNGPGTVTYFGALLFGQKQ